MARVVAGVWGEPPPLTLVRVGSRQGGQGVTLQHASFRMVAYHLALWKNLPLVRVPKGKFQRLFGYLIAQPDHPHVGNGTGNNRIPPA